MNSLWFLARRFLSGAGVSRRGSVWITAFTGVFLASVFVLTGIGILAGFQDVYYRAVLEFNSHIVLTRDGGFDPGVLEEMNRSLDAAAAEFPHRSTPYVFHETLMPTAQGMKPVILKGVQASRLREMYPFEFKTNPGAEGRTPVFAGVGVADLQPGVRSAASLKILSLRDARGNPRSRYETIPVTGTFKSGLYHFDSQFVLMDAGDLRSRYVLSDGADGVEIRLGDPARIGALAERLRRELPDDVTVTTWDELNAGLLESLRLERTAFVVIAFLILSIASLNVFGFNFLFFLERKREFLVLSLLGLSRRRMGGLFRLLSLLVGAVATAGAAACAWGLLKALNSGRGLPLDPAVYFVDRVPALFRASWALFFVAGAWILCVITAWIAARAVLRRRLSPAALGY